MRQNHMLNFDYAAADEEEHQLRLYILQKQALTEQLQHLQSY